MKKMIFAIIVLISFFPASAQPGSDTLASRAITATGKPSGKITELKIGKDGGSLSSADGKIQLVIPEGAVAKKTTFSIQPVTNMVPNGNGMAYHLQPSGTRFNKPVQLIFHYDPDELQDTAQLLTRIAMQDEKGQWYGLNKFTLDTIAKTISGNINHFSTWATFQQLRLTAIPMSKKRIKVKTSVYLTILGVTPGDDNSGDELATLDNWRAPVKGIWRVNNVVKGNTKVGTLHSGVEDATTANFNTYSAPATLPDENPVAISIDLVGASFLFEKVTMKKLKLVTHLLIYDNAYEVKMVSSINGTAGSQLGKVTYKDTGSFVVSLDGKEPTLIEKVNKNAAAELDYAGRCQVKPLKVGSGNIHVAGRPSIKIIPPVSPGGNAIVEMTFSRYPSIFPLLQFTCPDLKGGTFTDTNAAGNAMMAAMLAAFPQQIRFEAKEEEQTILSIGKEGSELYVKFTVKQIKDD